MIKDQRVNYFKKLLSKKENVSMMPIWFKGERKVLPVYEIDLDFLVYNPYNGRIASLVKSYEKQEGKRLDPTNTTDIKTIESFLWDSNKESNKNTKKSIFEQGQLKYGIVTKDGVIIDGNRRGMILKKVAEEKKEHPFFLGVVLDEELDENPVEIMRLETSYQMGEDAKVDYNATEKYLKCKDFLSYYPNTEKGRKDGIDGIAKSMGVKPQKIEEYLSIMKLMDEYLDKIGSSGIYTRLDKTEGAFVDLNNYLNRYKSKKSALIKWKYDDTDLNDLKLIYFDYIRTIYNKDKKNSEDEGVMGSGDSKDYRFIGQTSKKGSFFSNRNIWEEFRDNHFNKVDKVREAFEEEYSVDNLRQENPGKKLDEVLKGRDSIWAKKTISIVRKNLNNSKYKLDLKIQHEEPMELLRRAKNTLESIDTKTSSFLKDKEILNLIHEISKILQSFKLIINKK